MKGSIVEISSRTALVWKELQKEKQGLIQMVTALNTVQRKGKTINVIDIDEDDDVDT